MPDRFDVAIVGGGFAGTVVAAQLARLVRTPLRIVMFDRAGAFGRGAAYSPKSDQCLLNVRAGAMGAFPDAEDDFLTWLRNTGYGNDDAGLGDRYVARRLYGDYVSALFERYASATTVLERHAACVTDVAPSADGYALETANTGPILAATVVLAIGNLPPGGLGDAALSAAMAAYACNPWELLARDAVDRDADVVIVGTGLSALDMLLHLAANGHRGTITMLSRHGRFPLAHVAARSDAVELGPVAGTPRDVFRTMRRLVREAAAAGSSWHEVVDALRPQVNTIWDSWSVAEQRQFYRHVAPTWEIHRHRAPNSTLAVRDAFVAGGQLRVGRGRLTNVTRDGAGYRVGYVDPERKELTVPAGIIVDCTGPRRDITKSGDALIEALFARNLARPGQLGIGFDAAQDGRLLGNHGTAPLYALGTPLRGTFCESSAVREIRVQALTIAEAIVAGTIGARS